MLITLRKSWARFRAIFLSLGAPWHDIHPIRNYGDINSTCGSREDSEAASLDWALHRQHLCCSYFAQIHPPNTAGRTFSCFCPPETPTAIPWKTTGQDLSLLQAGLSIWGEWHTAGQILAAVWGCCHTQARVCCQPCLTSPSTGPCPMVLQQWWHEKQDSKTVLLSFVTNPYVSLKILSIYE